MERSPGFWPALALALVGHAAVLGWLAAHPPPAPHGSRAGGGLSFQTRTVLPAPAPAAVVPEPPAAPVPAVEARAPGERKAPPQPPATAPAHPAVAAPAPALAAVPAAGDAPYLPRGQLTVPPRLQGVLDVPFPQEVRGVVDLKVRITLFIDERGSVQRIRVDSGDVHPAFERVIREAFGAARFSAGEVDRVSVRSQVRMEVEFQAPVAQR